ncbi:MAG TPA: hypothetical protein VGY57_15200 [Vicinamibacterales bacterium]|nr:hypothetical protein [Vicinamibacterales bacterium]
MHFTTWETFYVIVGSAAAAMTGLMFVAVALAVDVNASTEPMDAFGTPTVVHFGTVLLVSMLMSAPWPAEWVAQLALGACGAAGLVYIFIVMQRARRQKEYEPVFEDWLFHTALPMVSYAGILAAAAGLARYPIRMLFPIAGATGLLMFSGIHNAWDTVTYLVARRVKERAEARAAEKTS